MTKEINLHAGSQNYTIGTGQLRLETTRGTVFLAMPQAVALDVAKNGTRVTVELSTRRSEQLKELISGGVIREIQFIPHNPKGDNIGFRGGAGQIELSRINFIQRDSADHAAWLTHRFTIKMSDILRVTFPDGTELEC